MAGTAAACLTLVLAARLAFVQPAPLRLLFVGNSLTYINDVVAETGRRISAPFSSSRSSRRIWSLEDHWHQGDARRAIARGGWDVVVLQQGPSALPESRALLIDCVRRFDREIKKAGAATALYMVWPAQARRGDFPGVSRSYAAAARAVGGRLLPAGDAWREAWKQDARLALYGPDAFHPSLMGSQLAALTIFQALTGQPPTALPFPNLTAEQTAVVRQAASEAVDRHSVGLRWKAQIGVQIGAGMGLPGSA